MSPPLVSILMPVYNGRLFLSQAIDSIVKQSFSDFELLVIDDGSADDSAALAERTEDARIRVLRNGANLGLVATLNRGLAEARGEWIARCDCDDLWFPRRLEVQLDLCRRQPDVALVGADALLINEQGLVCGGFHAPADHELLRWDLCFRNPFVHSAVLFRRTVAGSMGGYADVPASEDYDLWSRIAASHQVASVLRPLVKYRMHGSSVMARENAVGREKKSYPFLKEIMQSNLRQFAGEGAEVIAHLDAWLQPASERFALRAFWQAYSRTWESSRGALANHNSAIGEHALNMLYRQRQARQLPVMDCLRAMTPAQLFSLPWLRALGACLPAR